MLRIKWERLAVILYAFITGFGMYALSTLPTEEGTVTSMRLAYIGLFILSGAIVFLFRLVFHEMIMTNVILTTDRDDYQFAKSQCNKSIDDIDFHELKDLPLPMIDDESEDSLLD